MQAIGPAAAQDGIGSSNENRTPTHRGRDRNRYAQGSNEQRWTDCWKTAHRLSAARSRSRTRSKSLNRLVAPLNRCKPSTQPDKQNLLPSLKMLPTAEGHAALQVFKAEAVEPWISAQATACLLTAGGLPELGFGDVTDDDLLEVFARFGRVGNDVIQRGPTADIIEVMEEFAPIAAVKLWRLMHVGPLDDIGAEAHTLFSAIQERGFNSDLQGFRAAVSANGLTTKEQKEVQERK
ncbi:hypothetical protein V8E36_006712 [Tilletia maclaganii]